MKKMMTVLLASLLVLSVFAGCSEKKEEEPQPVEETTVMNLNGLYTIDDPEGLEYETRTILYMPVLEEEEIYGMGARDTFVVFYGKENTGVGMYTITVFDTEENCAAYCEEAEETQDGNVAVSFLDATFFEAMAAFMPELSTFIENYTANGAIEIDGK